MLEAEKDVTAAGSKDCSDHHCLGGSRWCQGNGGSDRGRGGCGGAVAFGRRVLEVVPERGGEAFLGYGGGGGGRVEAREEDTTERVDLAHDYWKKEEAFCGFLKKEELGGCCFWKRLKGFCWVVDCEKDSVFIRSRKWRDWELAVGASLV